MRLVNLTNHSVTLIVDGGEPLEYPAAEKSKVARVRITDELIDELVVEGRRVPIYRSKFGSVRGLPPATPGMRFIVSSIVADARSDRRDLVVPHDRVIDRDRKVIGARGLRINQIKSGV